MINTDEFTALSEDKRMKYLKAVTGMNARTEADMLVRKICISLPVFEEGELPVMYAWMFITKPTSTLLSDKQRVKQIQGMLRPVAQILVNRWVHNRMHNDRIKLMALIYNDPLFLENLVIYTARALHRLGFVWDGKRLGGIAKVNWEIIYAWLWDVVIETPGSSKMYSGITEGLESLTYGKYVVAVKMFTECTRLKVVVVKYVFMNVNDVVLNDANAMFLELSKLSHGESYQEDSRLVIAPSTGRDVSPQLSKESIRSGLEESVVRVVDRCMSTYPLRYERESVILDIVIRRIRKIERWWPKSLEPSDLPDTFGFNKDISRADGLAAMQRWIDLKKALKELQL